MLAELSVGTGCFQSCFHHFQALQYSAVSRRPGCSHSPGSPEFFILFCFEIFVFLKCFALTPIRWGDDGAQGALILFLYPKHCREWGQGQLGPQVEGRA